MTQKLSLPQLKQEWAMWNLSKFNGLPDQNARAWITRVDSGCQMRGIPVSQRMLTAIHFLGGSLKVVMKSVKVYLKSHRDIPSCVEKWDQFKNILVDLHGDSDCCLHLIDANLNDLQPVRGRTGGTFSAIASPYAH